MKRVGVALAKELCPICGKEIDGPIIINSLLTEDCAKNVEELNGQVIGISSNACDECLVYKDSAVFVIGIDPEKSDNKSLYRTGNLVGLKKDCDFINNIDKKYILETDNGCKYVFCDYEVGKQIGIW